MLPGTARSKRFNEDDAEAAEVSGDNPGAPGSHKRLVEVGEEGDRPLTGTTVSRNFCESASERSPANRWGI
ncbi:hypothetical protein JJD41_09110 [Oxynema sp. CENA135]|uniref:hypothetical protein n=1 Tax=Oxynema sp. CENA135 TaxID=984206 RepID=UPI001A5A30CE|nr:hypothetical protein [Oxynema sp. CENA135]MBK4730013.1 hypothetical protein [Oxynema sp. CENA135]